MNQPTNQPPSASFLRRAYRNQLFDHTGLLVGECGLDAKEVAIFPVRYALDESPEKGSAQGPNPLPSHWHGKQPELQTRSYTLRQLRDGWLYVWNSTDSTLDEYQVQGNHFTRHLWTSAELNQDVRNNPTTCEPYLLYPRECRLRIAYSPVQWTWRLCELMGTPEGQQSPWLRSVDLPAYCNSGELEHGAMLIELGKRVADIFEHGASAPSFTSTLLPTTASEPGEPCKPAFEECLVRGLVPDQNTALFVALDDPLALLDDLNMNLAGRFLEQNQFQAAHEHELHSAFAVQRLCGFDADALMPKTLKDPLQRQDYTDDLYGLLAVSDEIEAAKDLVQPEVQGLAALAGEKMRQQARARFQAKWGHLPAPDTWQAVEDEWQAKRPWRADVRFDEMRQYVSQTTRQAEQLQAHCQRSERDLLTWVNRLGTRAEALYHDTGNAEHASQLLETARALYTNLAIGEAGQRWLHEQATAPTTLMGLALYNFDPDVAALIKQVSYNFSTTGMLDDQGRQGDGSTPGLDLKNSGDIASIATRVQEIKGVLDIDAVTESRLYQGMSNVAKQALHTLIDVANQQAADAWHSLSLFLLPAMKGQTALTLAATQVLISSEVATHTHLLFNPEYPDEFKTWLRHTWALNNKIDGARQVLQRPGHPRDHRATRIALQQLEAQRQAHLLDKPNRITARASGDTTRLNANRQTIQGWLSDLGRSEVRAQAQLKQTDGGRYHARISAWANQNLGQALPVLVLGLNLWNFHNTAEQAQKDGQYSADEWRKLGASAAYTANALMTLWVVPTWDRAGKMWAPLGKKTTQVAKAGYYAWKDAIATAVDLGDSAKAATAQEFATFSKRLIVQTVSWALLGAVAAGLEAWQLESEASSATSTTEKKLIRIKQGVLLGMFATATA